MKYNTMERTNACLSAVSKEFCTCPVDKCPRHPNTHELGCDPCIGHNLEKRKMPACFFRVVREDVSGVSDYSIESFVDFFLKHRDEYEMNK